jgi:hypothetical protein
MSVTPAATMASASTTFWQHTPVVTPPDRSCATAGIAWVGHSDADWHAHPHAQHTLVTEPQLHLSHPHAQRTRVTEPQRHLSHPHAQHALVTEPQLHLSHPHAQHTLVTEPQLHLSHPHAQHTLVTEPQLHLSHPHAQHTLAPPRTANQPPPRSHNLQLCDLSALVALGVRPDGHALRAREQRESTDPPLPTRALRLTGGTMASERAMLPSSASKSTMAAGESTSSSRQPTTAGGLSAAMNAIVRLRSLSTRLASNPQRPRSLSNRLASNPQRLRGAGARNARLSAQDANA